MVMADVWALCCPTKIGYRFLSLIRRSGRPGGAAARLPLSRRQLRREHGAPAALGVRCRADGCPRRADTGRQTDRQGCSPRGTVTRRCCVGRTAPLSVAAQGSAGRSHGARTAGLLSCRRCSGHGPEPHGGTRTVCNSREGGGEIEKVSEENLQENLSHTKQGRREIGDSSGISSGGWLLRWGRLGAD